ncbi:DUF4352 domain-containing protein [Paenibacillus whitsoniae]|nr:DUF4352 domain-containing protein [Paenibacillus whitsoniae]
MWIALSLIGFFAALIFLVMGVIGAIKKNGTAKKRFLWALASFIAFVVGASNLPRSEKEPLSGQAETVSAKVEDKEAQKAAAAAEKAAEDKAKAEEKAKKEAEAKAAEEAKAPRTGDTVSVGSFSVLVNSPSTEPSIGNQFLSQKAKGVYWVFPVSVRNDDKEARTVDSSMFQLVSNAGVKYDPDPTAAIYANNNSPFFLEKINPGIVIKGFVVFDMPTDQQIADYKMQVRGGIGFKTTKPVDIILKPKE